MGLNIGQDGRKSQKKRSETFTFVFDISVMLNSCYGIRLDDGVKVTCYERVLCNKGLKLLSNADQ